MNKIPYPDDANNKQSPDQDLAANLIRQKVNNLYASEPDAETEEDEALTATKRSVHQQFMYELTTSGKDLVQIQTAWHEYYQGLSEEDKKQVWQEFYASNQHQQPAPPKTPEEKVQEAQVVRTHIEERVTKPKRRSAPAIRRSIKENAGKKPKLTMQQHLQSMAFGIGLGLIVVFILLFSFFNQVFIAPFIQPSRHDTATPIILSSQSAAPTKTPEVIIPKINVEIPITYNISTNNENVLENFLQDGVIHYPGTAVPGQDGNAAYFGHSSNNILNPGKYKFAFVLLHDLVKGDVFYLTYNDKVYAYKVFYTHIVDPSDVGVLNPLSGHPATATLITCDPPGTSINRLVVVGDQISPAPTTNSTSQTATFTTTQASSQQQLPGNGPSLWQRVSGSWSGKLTIAACLFGAGYVIYWWLSKEFKKS